MKTEDTEVGRRVARFEALAREAGLKLTHQRREIFRALASTLDHPSAETVHRAVQVNMPTLSLDTVYRTLWTLTDLGLVRTLGPRQSTVRFDANIEQHHHYVCTCCGLVRDFESEELDALEVPATVSRFGQITSAHLEVRGICERCTNERGDNAPPNEPRLPTGKEKTES